MTIRKQPIARFAFAFALFAIASLISRAADNSHDWPQFLGPDRNGTAHASDIAPWKSAPRVVWKRDVGQGFAGPVVVDGKCVLFHRVGDKETVECLDAATGARKWLSDYATKYVDDFGFDEGPRATPAVSEGQIFTYGADGALNCWELATGKNRWFQDLQQTMKSEKGFFGRACSPLVEGNAVILNVGGEQGAGVVAFDKATGKVIWKATDDEAGYSSPVCATIAGRRSVLAFTRAGLRILSPADGQLRLSFSFRSRNNASVNAATPIAVGDQIFLSASYETGAVLLNIDAKKGPDHLEAQPVWRSDDALSSHYATPVYRDGYLYGFHGRQEQGQDLHCVEWTSGKTRWSEDSFGAGTVLLAGDELVILREKGELVLAEATHEKFALLAHTQILPGDCRAYPALAGGLFYARSKEKMVCVDLRDGH